MKSKMKMISIVLLAVLVATAFYAGRNGIEAIHKNEIAIGTSKETIRIWYADEALTDYMNSAAIAFGEAEDIRVLPVLATGLEYLEEINRESVKGEETPDLFVLGNDALEKAYLSGLASEISSEKESCDTKAFPNSALQAVTYKDKLIGYPFYYETSILLYNKTYIQSFAEAQEREVSSMVPKTMDDILSFADNYDAPDEVEAVFKWDVSDIFYNYFFVGAYLSVGGEAGYDTGKIDIYNQNTIDCLRVYQNLNQFFSIDTKEVSYDTVMQDFIDGKIVFTIATTDAIRKVEEAKKNGEFQYEYEISTIPDLNGELKTRSLSVTSTVAVNGYSEHKKAANAFARFLTNDYVGNLYHSSGKASSKLDVDYENPKVGAAMNEYRESIPMPKMLETSNFWVQLEIAFTKIWMGEDVNAQLKQLSEQVMTQVTGEPYVEEPIVEPVIEETEEEYRGD